LVTSLFQGLSFGKVRCGATPVIFFMMLALVLLAYKVFARVVIFAAKEVYLLEFANSFVLLETPFVFWY
jgi:hypothetical protein